MGYATVDVDIDEVLDQADADDLAKALIQCTGWREALNKVLEKKEQEKFNGAEYYDFDLRTLVEKFRMGKDIAPIISTIAYSEFGLIV